MSVADTSTVRLHTMNPSSRAMAPHGCAGRGCCTHNALPFYRTKEGRPACRKDRWKHAGEHILLQGEVTSESRPECLQSKVLPANILPAGERCVFLTDLRLPLSQSAGLALLLTALTLPSFHTNNALTYSTYRGALPSTKSTPSRLPRNTGLLDTLWFSLSDTQVPQPLFPS